MCEKSDITVVAAPTARLRGMGGVEVKERMRLELS